MPFEHSSEKHYNQIVHIILIVDKVVVEYDYTAKEPDELTIRKGDIITDVIKKPGGWWEGSLRDKKGMFPDNFVHLVDKESSVVLRNQKDISRIRQCRVIFSYSQEHEDELNLKVGDVIDIIGEEEEGWWKGSLNGKQGVFPSNFVQEVIWQPSPSIRVSNNIENENNSKPPQLPAKPSKKFCEATYSYKAQNPDELSFEEGDTITILNKDSQDPGWWQGELNGKIGVFPDNFVVLLSDNRISNSENRKKSLAEKGVIQSTSVASQRKSLEHKKEAAENDTNLEINKSPPLPSKNSKPIKKSTSGAALISELKNKIEDAVDGSTGSKQVANRTSKNMSNDFDLVERRSLLVDVRATRVKAPGRRPPTSAPVAPPEEPTIDSNIKPRLRELDKQKVPWLEEMKKNQVKRTLMSTLEGQLTENTDNLEVDTAKVTSPPKVKTPNEIEEKVKFYHDRNSVSHLVKDIPEEPKNTPRDSVSIALAGGEVKRDNSADILERLNRLEETVQRQNSTIEDLQNKLQIEIDKRILLQEKINRNMQA